MVSGTLPGGSTNLGYDGFGRRNSVVHSDGSTGAFQRDLLNRITQVIWTGPTPISMALGYDLAGNISSLERENSSASTIAYDAADQILSSSGGSIESRSFSYDALGNPLQDSVNGAGSFVSNFLTSNGVASYLADPNGFGDLVQETKAGVTKNYTYRADGRISGYLSGSLQVAYFYDALGRLAAKAISDGVQNFTQSYTYIGQGHDLLQSKAGDGTITSYLEGQGINEHLAESKNGVFRGYVTDNLNSVLNSEMAGPQHRFSLFGAASAPAPLSIASDPASFGFAGGMHNRESKSTKFDWRDLHHETGRWGQLDPIGLESGDENDYRYVANSPLMSIDADGLCPCGSPDAVIEAARADDRDWSKKADRTDVNEGFGSGEYKCNLFAKTEYEKAGYNLPNQGGGIVSRILGRYPPGAKNLSDPNYEVSGWPVVSGPAQPGDLVAEKGHVGISTGNGKTISATPVGKKENDWGARPGQKPVVRRCRCQ